VTVVTNKKNTVHKEIASTIVNLLERFCSRKSSRRSRGYSSLPILRLKPALFDKKVYYSPKRV